MKDMTGMKAGLLYHLLPPAKRSAVKQLLAEDETAHLNASFAAYRKMPKTQREEIEKSLHGFLKPLHFPVWLFAAMTAVFSILFIFHSALKPELSFSLRYDLFSPLFLASLAPLSAFFIPAWRFRYLFRLHFTFEKAALALLTFLILLWLIIYIRLEEKMFSAGPDAVTLLILGIAAAGAPFLEEIFFREMLPSLFGRHPFFAGHLISALCFSAAHIPSSPYMALLYLLSALFLSALRINTDSLLIPWGAHAGANVISLLV